MGTQTQIIAVLLSIVVHVVEIRDPYVWSADLPALPSVKKRRMDAMMTLSPISISHGSDRNESVAYINPKPQTAINPIFARVCIFSRYMTGKAIDQMITSVEMLKAALAYQKSVMVKQCPPGIVLSQENAIGLHCKIEATTLAMAYDVTKPIMQYTKIRNLACVKTRI